MHPQHTAIITRFYKGFARRDWAEMASCYHTDVHFSDPVFDLRGVQVGQMWRMLCTSGRDLQVTFDHMEADAEQGRAHWEARYTFSGTGRPVHNLIDAQFEFKEGLIYRHRDHFDFWRWSRQALGAPGLMLGWSRVLQRKVQRQANQKLVSFVAKLN